MKIAPFRIQKIFLDTAKTQVNRRDVDSIHGASHRAKNVHVSGYSVTSTAPYNIDDKVEPNSGVDNSAEQARRGIDAIAQDLHRIKTDPTISEPPQLVIAVHGYNTAEPNIRAWYHDIYRYVAHNDKQVRQQRNLVFIGYRWSSEQIPRDPMKLLSNLKALPDVPRTLLIIGLVLLVAGFMDAIAEVSRSLKIIDYPPLSIKLLDAIFSWFGVSEIGLLGRVIEAIIILATKFLFGIALIVPLAIAVLILLRLSVYFRDVYRALNFAVPDLTELIRRLDKALIDIEVNEINRAYAVPIDALQQAKKQGSAPSKRINLSFLGHSMGGLVITNVVRILSDVFDHGSIAQHPSSEIGHTLRLSRLILASPDIPVLSVVSSRANGLASSLRRFDEAYLFSNEGDLALKLASTAANYISFPSAHHHHGHRLGSIALRDDVFDKGIINLEKLRETYTLDKTLCEAINDDECDILKCLVIAAGRGDRYQSLDRLFTDEHHTNSVATLADLFTFFDCTDYKDFSLKLRGSAMNAHSDEEKGLLTRAKSKSYLSLWDYIELFWDMARGHRDVHGGYFYGEYSRELIYRLAFLGFDGTMKAIAQEAPNPIGDTQASLDVFDQRCKQKGIQLYLSPLRYRVDIQGAELSVARMEMLQTVKAAAEKAEGRVANCPPVQTGVASAKPDSPLPVRSTSPIG